MIEELVPADTRETALERTQSIAREIAQRSPLAVAHIKRLAREAVSPVSRDMFRLEAQLFGEPMRSPEAKALLAQVASRTCCSTSTSRAFRRATFTTTIPSGSSRLSASLAVVFPMPGGPANMAMRRRS